MPARIARFVFSLSDLDDLVEENHLVDTDGKSLFNIPDSVERGIRRRWVPISVDADPESGSVWVWAYLTD